MQRNLFTLFRIIHIILSFFYLKTLTLVQLVFFLQLCISFFPPWPVSLQWSNGAITQTPVHCGPTQAPINLLLTKEQDCGKHTTGTLTMPSNTCSLSECKLSKYRNQQWTHCWYLYSKPHQLFCNNRTNTLKLLSYIYIYAVLCIWFKFTKMTL